MFRIADGEPLGYDDPPARGHSIEFRINAEDPARNFLPGPGTITVFSPPSGPGVRLDSGYASGMTVPQVFDSLIAKLIVTGASRAEALQRAARALGEFEVGGMPTVLPFHRAVVADPAFADRAAAGAHPLDRDGVHRADAGQEPAETAEPRPTGRAITVEVGGKRLSVVVPAALSQSRRPASAFGFFRTGPRWQQPQPARAHTGSGDTLVSPMQGTIIKIAVADGERVSAGDAIVVLEAMKMEQPLTAHKDGTVTAMAVIGGPDGDGGRCHLRAQGLIRREQAPRRSERGPEAAVRDRVPAAGPRTGSGCGTS